MQAKNTSRNYSLDLIRVFAFFCVVSIHFFLHTGYNFVVIQGGRMYVSTLIQSVFPICVPLFLILSGYLQKKKTPSRHYYKRLLPILAEYLAASICCTVYRALSQGCPEGIFPFLLQELLGIFAYTTAPYGWYIEMFIGLFLLIPYLNILYSQLADRRRKQMLLLTLLVLTSLPSLTNTFSLTAGDTLYQIRLLPQW